MTDDAFDFETPPALDAIRRIAMAGGMTPSEAIDLAYAAGYGAGRRAGEEWNPTGRIVRVGQTSTPEVRS